MIRCFFIGHHHASAQIFSPLFEAVNTLVSFHPAISFYVGTKGSFDHYSAQAVIAAKKNTPMCVSISRLPITRRSVLPPFRLVLTAHIIPCPDLFLRNMLSLAPIAK